MHHKITLPQSERGGLSESISGLLAPEGISTKDDDALVDAVRNGDILIFQQLVQKSGRYQGRRDLRKSGRPPS